MRFENSSSSPRTDDGLENEAEHFSPLAVAPAFLPLLFYSAFLSLDVSLGYPIYVSSSVAALFSMAWLLTGTVTPNKSSLPLLAIIIFVCGAGATYLHMAITKPPVPYAPIKATAEVQSSRQWGFGSVALVCPEGGDKFLLYFDREGGGVVAGDVVSFSGRTEEFRRAEESGGFDEFFYWRAKGAVAKITNPKIEVIGTRRSIAAWRAALGDRIRATLPPQTAGYMLAVVTGERDSRLESLHRSVGTSHLLAVSGFHVGIIFAAGWFLLRRFPFRLWLISALIWFYVTLTGAAPSALRAAFMIQLAIAGRMLGRAGNSFNAACAAGALMLIFNPWLFWDIGWRLSMLAILSVTSVVAANYSNAAKLLLASPLVWLATSLQSAWTFESVPLAGIPINFIAIAAFAFLFPFALVCSVPALIGAPGGYWVAMLPELVFSMWERLSSNVLFLFPWKMSFSLPLLLAGGSVMAYFFAKASGFRGFRPFAASLLVFISLSALVLLV